MGKQKRISTSAGYNPTNRLAEIEQTGVLKVDGLFTPDDIQEALSLLDPLVLEAQKRATPSKVLAKLSTLKNHSHTLEFNRTIATLPELRKTIVFQKARAYITELTGKPHHYAFDHAIYKNPHSPASYWHQDQAYKGSVETMRSLHMWIPLHDIEHATGGMEYIPKNGDNRDYPHQPDPVTGALKTAPTPAQLATRIIWDTPVGSALIHDPHILHRSAANQTNTVRKAWILHFSPFGMMEPLLPRNLIYRLKHQLSRQELS